MATTFKEFSNTVVLKSRGETRKTEVQHSSIKVHANNMDVSFPNQLFINGEFIDSESGAVLNSVNPTDESVICQVNYKYRVI
jgi:formyltetrahydrofolate dehydrogenase